MRIKEVQQRGPSAERNARRRATTTSQGAEADPQAVHDLADELAALPGRLGTAALTPVSEEDEGRELEVVVDPEATSRAEVTLSALAKESEVPEAVRGPAQRLSRDLGRQAALLGCQSAAQQLEDDLSDTERAAAREEGSLQGEFFRLLDGYLDGSLGLLTAAQREQLRAATAPIRQLRDEALAAPLSEADKTRAASAEAATVLDEAAREAHMREIARDLDEDRPVSERDLAAALDSLRALSPA